MLSNPFAHWIVSAARSTRTATLAGASTDVTASYLKLIEPYTLQPVRSKYFSCLNKQKVHSDKSRNDIFMCESINKFQCLYK